MRHGELRQPNKQDTLGRLTALARAIIFHGTNNDAPTLGTVNCPNALFEVCPLVSGIVDRSLNRSGKIPFDRATARLRGSGFTSSDIYQPLVLVQGFVADAQFSSTICAVSTLGNAFETAAYESSGRPLA